MEKNKFVLKCFLGHFECFKQLFFLVENWPILTPRPPLVENSTIFFWNLPLEMYDEPPTNKQEIQTNAELFVIQNMVV